MSDISFQYAQEEFERKLLSGEKVDCPCCRRYAQIYKRTIHKNLVMFMLAMHRAPKDAEGYVDIPDLLRGFRAARDFCILKYWGLIQQRPNDNEKIRTSGLWRLTPIALDFLFNGRDICKHAIVFDDRVIRFIPEYIRVRDVLGEQFDYSKLVA